MTQQYSFVCILKIPFENNIEAFLSRIFKLEYEYLIVQNRAIYLFSINSIQKIFYNEYKIFQTFNFIFTIN